MPVVRISEELFKEIQKYAEPLVDNFETALWKALRGEKTNHDESVKPKTKTRKAKSYVEGGHISPSELWRPILEVLMLKEGSATRLEVHEILKKRLEGKLKPGDTALNRDGTLKWEKQVDYQRLAMANEGLLKKDSPRGKWEITEQGRRWFSNH